MTTETLQLSPEQQAAIDQATAAVQSGKRIFRIGGYAGTGKTTVARYIRESIEGCMPCAFTGKAAYRLREKGVWGTATVHKTIYNYNPETSSFILKDELGGNWMMIDEGSMICDRLWTDILSFGVPCVLLGDPGQLEPVGKDPRLMHQPDVVLRQIHRQAQGSGIVQFATDIRLNKYMPGMEYGDDVSIQHGGKPTYGDLKWADIVLCGFNATRCKINHLIRQVRGVDTNEILCPGETIIVLKNNYTHGLFNGQMLTIRKVLDVRNTTIDAVCITDDGDEVKVPLLKGQFGSRKAPDGGSSAMDIIIADYGYCITCHKAQGSEWGNVLIIDEQNPKLWEPRRWRYTAITRAARELKMCFWR